MKKLPPNLQRNRGEADEEYVEAQTKLQRGLMFSAMLPKEADALRGQRRFARRGRQADLLVPPEGPKKYRVIYADLSVRDADTPPSMPIAPIAQMEQDLIDTLHLQPVERRAFPGLAGLRGGFPDGPEEEFSLCWGGGRSPVRSRCRKLWKPR